MTAPTYAELLSECEALRARVAELERVVAERGKAEPRPLTSLSLYPKRDDEK